MSNLTIAGTCCAACGGKCSSIKRIPSLLVCESCRSGTCLESLGQDYYEASYAITSSRYDETEHRRLFRLPEQTRLLRDIRRAQPPPARILDFGCDKGFFLDEARRVGYETLGVEPSRSARDYCARIGITSVSNLDEAEGPFDVVTMWHSLEHVPDPFDALKRVEAVLKPTGSIFIRVPNFGCVWSRLQGQSWLWFQGKNHRTHFTSDGLRRLLERAGLGAKFIKSQRPDGFIDNAAFALASRCFGRRPLKKTFGRFYQQITCVELYCQAKKLAA